MLCARRFHSFVTLFPVGSVMRANLSVYREMDDPWLREFREALQETLLALMPGLRRRCHVHE
jgi:hypothetical protein